MSRPSNRTILRVVPLALALVVGACGATPRAHEPSPALTAVNADPEYERLCAGVAPDQKAKCPMGAWAQSADDVEGGVLLHLKPSAPSPEESQRLMRCHRAWMAHAPANAMPRCPIGSPGITITATAGSGGTDLSLLASKPEQVQEVRRRTHASLSR